MQIAVLSGKGGTGKTTIAGSFSYLARDAAVADCDVEAPNLHILMSAGDVLKEDFIGARVAEIDSEKCTRCGLCRKACRFEAIQDFTVNNLACEGCGACSAVCPEGAVAMKDELTGRNYVSLGEKERVFSHAELEIGAEGSGKLVTRVRKRALSVCGHFGVRTFVCINKYDLNECMSKKIEDYCAKKGYETVGKIPYDKKVLEALKSLKPVVLYKDSMAAGAIKEMYNTVMGLI